jgi:hypothetical protein
MNKLALLFVLVFGLFVTSSSNGQSLATITCLEVQGASVSISWNTAPNVITFLANHIYATDNTGGISEITQTTSLSGTYVYANANATVTPVCVYISTEDIVGGTSNFTNSETFCSTFLTVTASVSPPGFVNLQWNPPTTNPAWLAAVNAEVWLEYPSGVWNKISTLPSTSNSFDYEVTVCGEQLNFQIRYSGLPNCDFASNKIGRAHV